MTTTSRRLATDAKIVLEKAGYKVANQSYKVIGFRKKRARLVVLSDGFVKLEITSGTVDNAEVERLLEGVKK